MRGAKRKGVRYFGPYSHAWAIRETLDLLLRVFPARTCSAGVFKRAGQIGRPCLLGYIGKCSAPCVGRVSAERAPRDRRRLLRLHGRPHRHVRQAGSSARCCRRPSELEFERAARLRDDIAALRRAMEKQTVVLGDGTDADVVAFAEDPLEAAVQVFHVRDGRVRGQRGWVVEKVEDLTTGDLVAPLLHPGLRRRAGRGRRAPRAAGAGAAADAEALADWLSEHRGSRVTLRVPQRGDKKALMETVARNAGEALHAAQAAPGRRPHHPQQGARRDRRGARHGDRAAADRVLRRLADPGHRRGGVSMVVFEDGLARKSEYRRFAVRGNAGRQRHRRPVRDQRGDAPPVRPLPGGAAASPATSVRRRRRRRRRGRSATRGAGAAAARHRPADRPAAPVRLPAAAGRGRRRRSRRSTRPPRCWPTSASTDVALCGLAKRLEEVWLPGDDFPVILPRTSEALYLLQRVRDEAHRFAITFHRQRRSKRMTASRAGRGARPRARPGARRCCGTSAR